MRSSKILSALVICGLVAFASMPHAEALTCRKLTFTEKVNSSPNVVVAQVVKANKKLYHLKVVKILKSNKKLLAKGKAFVIDHRVPRMSLGWGFKPKKGHLVLFFFNAKRFDWQCSQPILLR